MFCGRFWNSSSGVLIHVSYHQPPAPRSSRCPDIRSKPPLVVFLQILSWFIWSCRYSWISFYPPYIRCGATISSFSDEFPLGRCSYPHDYLHLLGLFKVALLCGQDVKSRPACNCKIRLYNLGRGNRSAEEAVTMHAPILWSKAKNRHVLSTVSERNSINTHLSPKATTPELWKFDR